MPIEHFIVGTGITAKHRTSVAAPDRPDGDSPGPFGADEREALRSMFQHVNELNRRINAAHNWSLRVLAEAGIVLDSKISLSDSLSIAERERKARGEPIDSALGYAIRFLNLELLIEAQIERGEASAAAQFGIEFGFLFCEAGMKFQWEDHTLRGKRVKEGGQKGSEVAHGSPNDVSKRRAKIAARVQEEMGRGKPKMQAYEVAGREFGCGARTAMRAYRKFGKK